MADSQLLVFFFPFLSSFIVLISLVDNNIIICFLFNSQATYWKERRRGATGGWGWTLTLILIRPMKPSVWLKEWRTRCESMLSTALACLVTVQPRSLSCQSVSISIGLNQLLSHLLHLINHFQTFAAPHCSCDGWRDEVDSLTFCCVSSRHPWLIGLRFHSGHGSWLTCGHDRTGSCLLYVCWNPRSLWNKNAGSTGHASHEGVPTPLNGPDR